VKECKIPVNKKKQQVYRGHWLLMVTKAAIRLPGQLFCIVLIADQAFVHIVQGLKCRMAARPQLKSAVRSIVNSGT